MYAVYALPRPRDIQLRVIGCNNEVSHSELRVRGGGGVLDRRDVLDLMHGRSRMTIDRPSHPYNAGTENVGFSAIRQTLIAPQPRSET